MSKYITHCRYSYQYMDSYKNSVPSFTCKLKSIYIHVHTKLSIVYHIYKSVRYSDNGAIACWAICLIKL